MNIEATDIAIIGAGPAGAIAAALLRQYGYQVTVIERQLFPRFSIGESLLPQCMEFIEQAGMLEAVKTAGFQFKNGAAFSRNGNSTKFDFTQKFTAGPGTTFQVQRAKFDHILAQQAQQAGADIRYEHSLESVEFNDVGATLLVCTATENYNLRCKFLLDASGFGRVLPRLLNLEAPSIFPVRTSLFTHIEDNISDTDFDREKILITIHPEHTDVWYWLIPFADGRSSLGIVAGNHYFDDNDLDSASLLKQFVDQAPELKALLAQAKFDTPGQKLTGYSSNVKTLYGDNFALLGNAGEFLDPVFSSGVTIAMKSASLAAPLIHRQLQGETVDWESDYSKTLKQGVNTFRAYVEAWYDGRFQEVIFSQNQSTDIRNMISSILAGYAWDTDNPFVSQPVKRLNTLVELCRAYA
jgi:flavin-dependent dehydrogenase